MVIDGILFRTRTGCLDSMKAFMGEDYQAAHVPAQAQAVLADLDRHSAHCELLDRREQPLTQIRSSRSGAAQMHIGGSSGTCWGLQLRRSVIGD